MTPSRVLRDHHRKHSLTIVTEYLDADVEDLGARVTAQYDPERRLPREVTSAINVFRHERIRRWENPHAEGLESEHYDRDSRRLPKNESIRQVLAFQNTVIKRMPWPLVVLVALLIISAVYDLGLLLRSPVAVGIDGYYYVLQIATLSTDGRLYYPSNTPLVLYMMGGINQLLNDPVFSIKLSSVLLHELLCAGVAAIVYSVTRSLWIAVIGGLMTMTSGLRFYMISEFISNLGAIAIGLWCAWCFIQFFERRRKFWLGLSVFSFGGFALSHRSALPVAALLFVLLGLAYWLTLPSWKYRATAIFLLCCSWLTPLLIGTQNLIEIPLWLHYELVTFPRWSAATVAINEKLILLIVAPAVLALVYHPRRKLPSKIPRFVLAVTALWALTVTLNPFLRSDDSLMSASVRLSCLAYVQVAILVPGLIWLLLPLSWKAVLYVVAYAAPLVFMSSQTSPLGLQENYLRRRERLVSYLSLRRPPPGSDPIILAPHGDEFVVIAMLGVPSQRSWPRGNQRRYAVYWLLQDVESRSIASYPGALEMTGGRSSVIIEDEALRRELRSLGVAERQSLLRNNQHLNTYLFLTSSNSQDRD